MAQSRGKTSRKRPAPRPAFNWKAGAALAGGAIVGLGIAYVLQEKATPQPADYRVLASEKKFEIRAYQAVTVAETVVRGERKQALSEGFRRLADYIFAKSREGEKLPMTTPVLVDSGNPMASDPPVFDDTVEGGWRVRFVMPEGRSAGDLPPPPDGIQIVELPERRVGAVRFSGVADDDRLVEHEDALRGWLERHGETCLKVEPEYAFYNSPMIPPPLRRNEVLLALS